MISDVKSYADHGVATFCHVGARSYRKGTDSRILGGMVGSDILGGGRSDHLRRRRGSIGEAKCLYFPPGSAHAFYPMLLRSLPCVALNVI